MTGELSADGHALTYRETVTALNVAMPVSVAEAEAVAVELAAGLARSNLVLVELTPEAGLTRTGHEAATLWFSRKEDE